MPPTQEQARQTAIDAMAKAFTDEGMEPDDAAEMSAMLVDEAIQRGDS